MGRLCWSGAVDKLDDSRIDEMFRAENLYSEVAEIIKKGDSYVYRTDICSFSDPTGTQAVLRFAECDNRALLITHSFKAAKPLEIDIPDGYKIEKSLYSSWAEIEGNKLIITPNTDFEGNIYLLNK